MMTNLKIIGFAALLSFVTTGCAVFDTLSGAKKDEYIAEADEARSKAYQHIPKERKYSNIVFDEGFFVPKSRVTESYDEWFYKNVNYNFDEINLAELNGLLSRESGVVSRAVKESGEVALDLEKGFPLNFTGRLGDALKVISLATGYGYKIEDNLISWSQFSTKTFLLSVPPSVQSFRIGDKDKSNENSSEGGSGSTTIETLGNSDSYSNIEVKDLDVWEETLKSITMLKSTVGSIAYDKSSSLLLVKDYPRNIRAIDSYIEKLTDVSMTKVVFDFQFLEYTNNEGDSISLNMDLTNAALGFTTKDISGSFLTEFSENLLTDTTAASLGFSQNSGNWVNSKVLIEALQNQGVVSVLSRPTVLASHNKNAFVDLGNSIAFASSSSTNQNQTSTASGTTTTFLDLGTRISVVPTILDDSDELFIQLGIDMSSLEVMREFESNGSKTQQPDTNKRKMVLNFSAHSGETILITGNESNRNQYKSSDSGFWSMLFGGSRSSTEEYSEMLILITPRIVRHKTF